MTKTLVNPLLTDSKKKTLPVLNPQTNNRTPSRSTLDIVLIIHHCHEMLRAKSYFILILFLTI